MPFQEHNKHMGNYFNTWWLPCQTLQELKRILTKYFLFKTKLTPLLLFFNIYVIQSRKDGQVNEPGQRGNALGIFLIELCCIKGDHHSMQRYYFPINGSTTASWGLEISVHMYIL